MKLEVWQIQYALLLDVLLSLQPQGSKSNLYQAALDTLPQLW